jgi:hypothetical protein
MLLALDSADPPAEHDGMYPRSALLAANYSVPILWLSLFDTDGLVTWPGINGSTFTAVVQPRSECIERSRARLGEWSRRWPDVFGDMSEPWLSYLRAVERAYLAVWAEELSWRADSDQAWAAELRGYLSCLDDPRSADFHEALDQSYLRSDGSRLEPRGAIGLVTAGYTWARPAPWDEEEASELEPTDEQERRRYRAEQLKRARAERLKRAREAVAERGVRHSGGR